MSTSGFLAQLRQHLVVGTTLVAFTANLSAPLSAAAQTPAEKRTASPIEHVIVIIGENRSFDHVFATYVPKSGDRINNLLSEGIIKLDANKNAIPGPNFNQAQQFFATDTDTFLLSPPTQEYPNNTLPAPLVGGPSGQFGYFSSVPACPTLPNLSPAQCAEVSEPGLPAGQGAALASGGTGETSYTPDERINNVTSLKAGPFQITNGTTFPYNAYAASPVHRFYQMTQQLNCDASKATDKNPSGCNGQLFSYVEVTTGAGTNGTTQPPLCSADGGELPCFTYNYLPTIPDAQTTGEGSTSLAFYNVQRGDAPYFKSLADQYTMSDNFHQSFLGGTGPNHIMFGHADAIWFSNGKGAAAVPPNNKEVYTKPWNGGTNPDEGVVNEIEDPNPAPGTNNWYSEDGYGGGGYGSPVYGGGSYSDCSDTTQPGVGPRVDYLRSLGIDPHCEPGHYYLLNNYNPGYFGNGKNAYIDQNPVNTPFTVPPSSTPSLGDDLNANGISWKYYGDQWNNYVPDPYQLNYGVNGPQADEYCNICNPFQYDTAIMANPAQVAAHMKDVTNLYSDIAAGTLPAVSITKPSGYSDGHPASSKLNVFELYCEKIIDLVQNSPYWDNTAIFITFDEGGGYYDSGYVQPLDFFGDGTRIPLLVVSKYSVGGHITHGYGDHVSIDKFIERNWRIGTISDRSRDNFPNPITKAGNPYVPINGPAITDLFDAFNFPK
ncbi:MAG TPA: alkaline phosphatase family protein [Terriglobales bacterium]|nr:alkaline phosphatase family protein [Terriglobales bacterium]